MSKSIEEVFAKVKAELSSNQDLQIKFDKEANTIRIYGTDRSATRLASSALAQALEIAYTSAEHHPYWAMLYNSAEICKSVLDSWDAELSRQQMEEISWRCDEIKGAIDRLSR